MPSLSRLDGPFGALCGTWAISDMASPEALFPDQLFKDAAFDEIIQVRQLR
jgi:hypothetical protein